GGGAGRPPIRPSVRWYWVAGCALAAALVCVALAVAGFFSLNGQIRDFQRVRVPGQAVVAFAQPGGYVLYVERPGQCCSVGVGGGSVPFSTWSMRVGMQPVNGGPPVSISTWRGGPQRHGGAGGPRRDGRAGKSGAPPR